MFLPHRRAQPGNHEPLLRRQLEGKEIFWIVALSVFGVFFLALLYVYFRSCSKRRRHQQSKHADGPKAGIFSMARWNRSSKVSYCDDNDSTHEASSRPPETSTNSASRRPRTSRVRIALPTPSVCRTPATAETSTPATTTTVDRHTSVRSVMTLPAYRPDPSATERVLGREGERDGVDIVLEQPTAEQDEAMREEEMDALYQIRLFRRQQIAERDERRRLRHEARAANDSIALEEIRSRARADNAPVILEGLRAEHERIKETRKRSTSSVSYHDVGIARHDGTRVRANSTESERCGLLSDAASIEALSTRSRHHRREPSASSVFSMDSDVVSHRSRANSSIGDTPPRLGVITTPLVSPSLPDGSRARAGSSPEIVEADLADLQPSNSQLPNSPPGYEEVSLDDTGSSITTPNSGPPPGYTGPHRVESIPSPVSERSSANVSVMGSVSSNGSDGPSSGRDRLSLSVGLVPQIVVEPSSADLEGRGRMW